MIDGDTLTIELATKHLGGDGHAEHVTGELTMSVHVVDTSGSFEDLIFKWIVSDCVKAQSVMCSRYYSML